MEPNRPAMLCLRGISKYYFQGTSNEVPALEEVSLDVNAGEFVTIIGSNGAGKSTLLKTIAGLVQPDRGRIELQGADVTRTAAYRRSQDIGRIAQDPNESTCAVMTIEENLAMATMAQPKLLLLDEHLASLDPKTGELVMNLTGQLVTEQCLTTLMVTHNMHQAIQWGNRLIMMHRGRIILDVAGVEKSKLQVNDLIAKFYEESREELTVDEMLLS